MPAALSTLGLAGLDAFLERSSHFSHEVVESGPRGWSWITSANSNRRVDAATAGQQLRPVDAAAAAADTPDGDEARGRCDVRTATRAWTLQRLSGVSATK